MCVCLLAIWLDQLSCKYFVIVRMCLLSSWPASEEMIAESIGGCFGTCCLGAARFPSLEAVVGHLRFSTVRGISSRNRATYWAGDTSFCSVMYFFFSTIPVLGLQLLCRAVVVMGCVKLLSISRSVLEDIR